MIEIEQPLRLLRLKHSVFADLLENFMGGGTVIYTADEPDIIEIGVPYVSKGRVVARDYSDYKDLRERLTAARRKYGFAPVLVAMSAENTPLVVAGLDYALSAIAPRRAAQLHYNWNVNLIFGRALMEPDGAEARALSAYRVRQKTKFCNYVFSQDWVSQTRTRRLFCRMLSEYKRVDCAGKSLNNTDALFNLEGGHPTSRHAYDYKWQRPKLRFLSDYKFTIAFENETADHWLTEKPLQALAVGSVPIYWGCPQAGEYINPRSFINAHDYDSFDALVEHVKRVDNDPDLYEAYRAAPPLLPSSRFYAMKRDLAPFLERVVAEALRRRAAGPRDGWRRWRRHYQIAKLLYANRKFEWRYRRRLVLHRYRRAALRRLQTVARRLIVKSARRKSELQ